MSNDIFNIVKENDTITLDNIKIEVLTKINKDNLVFNKKYRNDDVEKMKMPLFTPFLLEMIYNSDEIPSFIEFFNEYCDKNLIVSKYCPHLLPPLCFDFERNYAHA